MSRVRICIGLGLQLLLLACAVTSTVGLPDHARPGKRVVPKDGVSIQGVYDARLGIEPGCERDSFSLTKIDLIVEKKTWSALNNWFTHSSTTIENGNRLELWCDTASGGRFDTETTEDESGHVTCPSDFSGEPQLLASWPLDKEPELGLSNVPHEDGKYKLPVQLSKLRNDAGQRVLQCGLFVHNKGGFMAAGMTRAKFTSGQCVKGQFCRIGSTRVFVNPHGNLHALSGTNGIWDRYAPFKGSVTNEASPMFELAQRNEGTNHQSRLDLAQDKFMDVHPSLTSDILFGVKLPATLLVNSHCTIRGGEGATSDKTWYHRDFHSRGMGDFGKCPLVLAHRATTGDSAMENTPQSLRILAQQGVDGAEIDIFRVPKPQLDKGIDKVLDDAGYDLVSIHDGELYRTIGIAGSLERIVLGDPQLYRVLAWKVKSCGFMAPLTEFLDVALAKNLRLDIELKPGSAWDVGPVKDSDPDSTSTGYAIKLGRDVGHLLRQRKYEALIRNDAIVVSSFDPTKTIAVNAGFSGPPIRTALTLYTSLGSKFQALVMDEDTQSTVVIKELRQWTPAAINDVHRSNMVAGAYTAFDETKDDSDITHNTKYLTSLLKAGLDFIETDNPSQTMSLLANVEPDKCRAYNVDLSFRTWLQPKFREWHDKYGTAWRAAYSQRLSQRDLESFEAERKEEEFLRETHAEGAYGLHGDALKEFRANNLHRHNKREAPRRID